LEKLKEASAKHDILHLNSMKQMYSELGFFIEKHPDSPKDIERTFDLTSIRHFALAAEEESQEYQLKIMAGHKIEGGIAINPTMRLLFSNLTELFLKIYLSSSIDVNQTIPENVYLLATGARKNFLFRNWATLLCAICSY
jgi:hypothetical protein